MSRIDAYRKSAQVERYSDVAPKPLQFGDGDGTLPPMGEVDAKIAAAEARTDTKITKIEGKLDLILQRLGTIEEKSADARGEARATRRYVVGTGLSLGALLIAIVTLAINGFNIGSKVDDIARYEAQQVVSELTNRQAIEAPTPALALPAPADNAAAPAKR